MTPPKGVAVHMKTLTQLLHIAYPLIQAGMAGGVTTPELVAAVSNAGGLGTIGGGYMAPEQLRGIIRAVKNQTQEPFAVNLFIPEPISPATEVIEAMRAHLRQFRLRLDMAPESATEFNVPSLGDQLAVVLEEKVPVFSFTFGVPSRETMSQLHSQGVFVMGTATTVDEAMRLDAAGVDAVVAQGSDAGGHRGTFLGPANAALIGTMALVPQVVDRVSVPVVAAGGIMDGRGLAASLALGAAGVQMGTAFLACPESGAHHVYKERVLFATEADTDLTSAYSGKPARGIRTEFMLEMETFSGAIPPYPIQNALTKPVRTAAAKKENSEFMSLWAGQGLRLTTAKPAAEIVVETVARAQKTMNALCTAFPDAPDTQAPQP